MTRSSPVPWLLALLGSAWTTLRAPAAFAEAPPGDTPVDVTLAESAPPRRILSIEWSPVPFVTIGKITGNIVLVPVDHHSIVLSPFYAQTTTVPIYVYNDQSLVTNMAQAQVPRQTFSGFGGELGYRYYTGKGGPRGFFAGPSLIFGAMTANAQNGDKTSYLDYGLAVDIGYEQVFADAVALSLGVGMQYTRPDQSIPNQQYPADVYANEKVFPRFFATIGWAF